MNISNNSFPKFPNLNSPTNDQKAGLILNKTSSLIPDDSTFNIKSLYSQPSTSKSAAPTHPKSAKMLGSLESFQEDFSKINLKEKNHKPYKLNFLKTGQVMLQFEPQNKSTNKSIFDSDSNQGQQKSELNEKKIHNKNVNLFHEPLQKKMIAHPIQSNSQFPQTASTIQEVKVQSLKQNKEKPSHQSSNSSCYSSQKSQELYPNKDLISLDEKPTSKTTYTMFQENPQIPPQTQQKPISQHVPTQNVVEGQKVEGQKLQQKKVYDQVQSLRQRVKQLQQLNKQYLLIIENLSFTANSIPLIPQQISNNNNSIEITEEKEKEKPNSTKKSEVYPKQQIFEQEEC